MMRHTATLSSKFQISIPKAVREACNWRSGQKFVFIPKGGGVLLVPAPSIDELGGIPKGADTRAYRDRKDRA